MKIESLLPAIIVAAFAFSASADDRLYCREFTKNIYVAGRMQQGYGTSCRMPDGSWKIQQETRVRYQNDDDDGWGDDSDDDDDRHFTHTRSYYYAPPVWGPPPQHRLCHRDHGHHYGWDHRPRYYGWNQPYYNGWYGGYRPTSYFSVQYGNANRGRWE